MTAKTCIGAPLRRDRKRDFASSSGPELLKSKVVQVLMTEGDTPKTSGELPWMTSFGSALHLLRHQRNDDVLAEMARVYIRDALKKWLPNVSVAGVSVRRENAALILQVRIAGINQGQEMVEIPI